MDLVREHSGGTIQQAGRQIASTHICELLVDLDHATLGQAIATNPMAFTRLLNALSRLTADELACARYHAEEAERQAQLQKEQAPHITPEDRSITPETLRRIEKMLHLR
jgi:monoamine oxidase